MHYIYIFLLPILLFTGCSLKYEKIEGLESNLEKVDFDEIKNFRSDNLDEAYEVFKKACEKSSKKELFKEVCLKANEEENAYEFFTNNFTPYKLYDNNGFDKGVITGYYEPLLNGSLEKSEKYQYPIYKVPEDLIIVDLSSVYPDLKKYRLRGKLVGNRLIPYDDRENLNDEKKEILAYVDNKVDLYFLHIQGSGKVKLENGDIINVGYANQNGRRYISVGKYMVQNKMIGSGTSYAASMQGMKKWFEDNPEKVDEVLNENPSFVFFEKREQGATGSLGVELVPKRNLAVDTRYIKLGMPVFINTINPVTKENIDRLMVAADTGGAIKGEIRADFFWGFSEEAAKYAGVMKEKGELYILVPNTNLNN